MRVELIAATTARQASLAPLLEQVDRLTVTHRVRAPGPGWPRQLALDGVDMLVLDSPTDTQQQDLAVLSEWMTRHPALGMMLLTDDKDPGFLLQAMRAGVREVLGQEPTADELQAALGRLQRHVHSMQTQTEDARSVSTQAARMAAFMPCKGGCGATFTAVNIAYLLAQSYQHDTVLVDLDLHSADASYYLSSDDHRNSLLDLTRHLDRLDPHLFHSSLHPVIPHLFLLPAPDVADLHSEVTAAQLDRVLQLARQDNRTVLLDLPPRLDSFTLKALDMADDIFLLVDNTVPQLRDAKRLLTLLRSQRSVQDKLRLVLNRRHPGNEVSAEHIERTLGLKIAHTLPADAVSALQAINQGVPLTQLKTSSPLVQALHSLIQQTWPLRLPKPKGWLERWF